MRYVAFGIGFLLVLCEAANQQAMNQASKTMVNVRELIRNTDPLEIVKNMTHDPNENHKKANPMAISLFKNLTNPANMKTYMRLVKESKINKKGDILKITMSFMNPDNLTPAGAIKTFKSLDILTVSELSAVNLQYFKVIAPQVIGHGYDKLYKYINENDLKEIARILFEMFKETDSENLIWLIERLKKDGKAVEKSADKLIHGKGESLINDWQNNSDSKLRDKVNNVMTDMKKVSNFEKTGSKLPALIEAFKKATVHFLAAVITDIQAGIADMDSKDLMSKATSAVKDFTKTSSALLEYLDFEELGTDAEKALNYIHKLDRTTAKGALGDLVKLLPPVDKIMEHIDRSDNALLMKVDKVKLEEILFKVNKTKLPEPMVNIGVDSFLLAFKHVDPKKTRAIVEFIVKEINVDNGVYKVVRTVILNIFFDLIKKSPHLSLSGKTLDEIKGKVFKGIESVDSKRVGNLAEDLTSDFKRLNVSLVADVITGANTVLKDLFTNDVFQKIFTDPKSFLKNEDKKIFTDTIYFSLDALKLINESQFSRRCNDLANLADDDLKKKINDMSDWVDSQFSRVENGSEVVKKLNLDDIFDFIASALTSIDLKSTCTDINAILRVNKAFNNESRTEIAELLWKAFRTVQKSLNSDSVDKEALGKVQDVLEALLQALTRSKSIKANDFRTVGVRLAVRSVKEFGRKKGFAPMKTDSDDDADQHPSRHSEKLVKSTAAPETTTESKKFIEPPTIEEDAETTQEEIMTIVTEAPKHRSKVVFTRRASRTTTPKPVPTEAVEKKVEKVKKEKNSTTEKAPISRDTHDGECSKHAEDLVLSLLSEEEPKENLWASKMLDASSQSHHTKMSNLAKRRECFSVKPPNRQFTGQFCQAKVHISFNLPEKYKSGKQLFLNETSPNLQGICIPSSCTAENFTRLVKQFSVATPISSFLSFTIIPESCEIKTTKYTFWDKVCLIVLLVLTALAFCSTAFELHQRVVEKDDQPNRFLCAFSFQTTWKQLFSTEEKNDWVKAIDGIRAVAIIWIISQASLKLTSTYEILNDSIDGMFIKQTGFIFPMNLYGATDLFLFSAGFLTVRSFVRSIYLDGHFDFIATIIKKYLRIATCIAAVLLLKNGLLRNEDIFGDEIQCTPTNWWHPISFIQNFMEDDKQCFSQGWLISLEMQLFVASLLILSILTCFKCLQWFFIAVLMVVSIILPLALMIISKYKITLFPTTEDDQFVLDMIKPYTRATPYVTGLILGYFIFKQQHFSKIRVIHSRVKWLLIMILSVFSILCCIFGAIIFLEGSKTRWGIAAYLALSRLGISVGIGVITYLCSHGYGGWLNDILSSGIFKVLGKLSFSTFLFHPFVIEMRLSRSTAAYMDNYTLFLGFIGDCVMSNLLGLVFCLLVELPVANLKKSLLTRAKITPVSFLL